MGMYETLRMTPSLPPGLDLVAGRSRLVELKKPGKVNLAGP